MVGFRYKNMRETCNLKKIVIFRFTYKHTHHLTTETLILKGFRVLEPRFREVKCRFRVLEPPFREVKCRFRVLELHSINCIQLIAIN